MSNRVGSTVVRTSQRTTFDPRRGIVLVESYSGQTQALLSLAVALRNIGVVCEVTEEGGRGTMTAQWGDVNDPSNIEAPNDTFEITTDIYEESHWNNPLVWAAASSTAVGTNFRESGDSTEDLVARWRDRVEYVVKSSDLGGPVPVATTGFTGMLAHLYIRQLAGETSYEIERCVLTRVRTFSIRYSDRVQLQSNGTVYSTGSLVSAFAVPSVIAGKLPATPSAAPVGTAWGWKKRQDRSLYTFSGKVEETRDWVFAPHSTSLYTHV